MATLNTYKSPHSSMNDENFVIGKQIAKQSANSVVKSKKTALADVGNTIFRQDNINSCKKVMREIQDMTGPKCKSPKFSPCVKIEKDDLVDENHNWSACSKIMADEDDIFLPKFQFTAEEIKSYCLDWNVNPPAAKLEFKKVDCLDIVEPKSPSWCEMLPPIDDEFTCNILLSPAF